MCHHCQGASENISPFALVTPKKTNQSLLPELQMIRPNRAAMPRQALYRESPDFVHRLYGLLFCSAVDCGSPDIHRIFRGNCIFFL